MSTRKSGRKPRVLRSNYLTPFQVADRLLVAPVTVRLWASRGLLRSVSTPGGHRRFRLEDVEAFAARRRTQSTQAAAPSRVLIIDDDPQYARYLERLMRSRVASVAVDVALDGFTAGIKCEAMRPDVVTLDLQMPDMDGFAVCRLLRDMFGDRQLRIVALSGFMSPENTERIRTAGADACVAKTESIEILLRALGFAATLDAQAARDA